LTYFIRSRSNARHLPSFPTTTLFRSVVDPDKWVPDGYACVRVDSRGCGRSPGYVELWSAREAKDFAQCIEWGGKQPWSNGKVGLDRKSTRLNSSHVAISYAVFCVKKI